MFEGARLPLAPDFIELKLKTPLSGDRLEQEGSSFFHIEIELLPKLSPKRLVGRFALVDLSSGELPKAAMTLAARSFAEKVLAAPFDDGGDDDEGGRLFRHGDMEGKCGITGVIPQHIQETIIN
jgi:hypothetical protein